jgi:hypothetical protein
MAPKSQFLIFNCILNMENMISFKKIDLIGRCLPSTLGPQVFFLNMGSSKDHFPTFFVNFNYPWKLKRFFLPKSLRKEAKIEIFHGVNLGPMG